MKIRLEICGDCERLTSTNAGRVACEFFWTGTADLDPETGFSLTGITDVPRECVRYMEYLVLSQPEDRQTP